MFDKKLPTMNRVFKMISSTKPATIDDLSSDLVCKLFEHLFHPKDLAACSRVNKRWHSLCSGFKIASLAVVGRSALRISDCYSDLKLDEDQDVCLPELFGLSVGRPLLSDLKHLTLNIADSFDLDHLNRFDQLVHLEINLGSLDETKVNLNLSKLNFLALRFSEDSSPLSIDCPQLSVLVWTFKRGRHAETELKHPETIKKLDTSLFGPELTVFKEVEVLITRQLKAICKDTLLSLPKLKELHYNEDIKYAFGGAIGTVNQMKLKLGQFMDEAAELRGDDFRFVFAGFALSLANVDQIEFGVQSADRTETTSSEFVYMRNYELLAPDAKLDFVSSLDYSILVNCMDDYLPDCFFKKFPRIRFVKTSAAANEDDFLDFLWSLGSVRSLYLEGVELSQVFFDQLPTVAPLLVLLQLKENEISGKRRAPRFFDFIGELSHFSRFLTDQQLSIESIGSLVSWLGRSSMENFVFQLKERSFSITKARGSQTISVWDGELRKTVFETEHPADVLKFFKQMAASDWLSLERSGRWICSKRRSIGTCGLIFFCFPISLILFSLINLLKWIISF